MDPLLVVFGFGVGVLVGTTGMGGGSLMTPLLILLFGIKPVVAVGTDVAHAAVLLWVAAAAHLVSGNVDLGLAATLLLGSVPGVWVGTGLATRLPERGLRPALGIVMFTSGLALLYKAGVDVPAAVLIAVPIVLGLGVVGGAARVAAAPRRNVNGGWVGSGFGPPRKVEYAVRPSTAYSRAPGPPRPLPTQRSCRSATTTSPAASRARTAPGPPAPHTHPR